MKPDRLSIFLILLPSFLSGCSADQRHPSAAAEAADMSRDDGGGHGDGASGSRVNQDDGSTDVEAAHAILIETRGLDLHRTARFVASVARANIIVVGGTMDVRSLDIEATDGASAIAELARQTNLESRTSGELTILGSTGSFDQLETHPYGGDDRAVDIDFCLANASEMLSLFADVSGFIVDGTLDGSATIFTRNASSTAILDVILGLSGALVATDGPTVLPSSASLPPVMGWTPGAGSEPCPQEERGSFIGDRMVFGSCVPVDALEFRGVGLIVGREPVALIVPRDGIPGPWQGLIVRRGHFVGHPRVEPSGDISFWRIESIEHHNLQLVLVEPTSSGSVDDGAPRITIPLASEP